ncbi:hypothetical protein RRF57_002343 [Xylaria bambusicola]|uniref:Uncharacterized protein n=1 Tax=Xylaria bambusicola TaxID=326684 RepID=A0AAN7UEE8_9PEZI
MAPHKVASYASKRPAPETWQMGTESFKHRMPHHDGIKALWDTKWHFPCTKSVYPFHDGFFEDFEPIFMNLIDRDINDGTSTAFTEAFFPTASSLERAGDEQMKIGKPEAASKLYLRAACVLRIARFPYITSFPEPSCAVKWRAWEMQKKVYMKAAGSWTVPITEVEIPHVHATGSDRSVIPAYVRVPNTQTRDGSHPTVLLFTGLDGYRPDNTGRCDEFLARGWASVTVEIPGTADCPADPADPTSPDRLWDSVFDWMCADGRFDMRHVVCWGLSSGGYYAVRAAHTHREQLAGVVAQGAGTHYFFAREWLEKAEGHEYPFSLLPALARKHGFDNIEEYLDGALAKFSLVETGIVDKPCAKLLLINVS